MRKIFALLAVAGATAFLPTTAAHADVITDGTGGILSGNQIIVPISIGIDVHDIAAAVLGHAVAY